jgi:hypothetical protein
MCDIWSKCDHPADTFMTTHVRQFNLCYRVTVWSSCGASFGV